MYLANSIAFDQFRVYTEKPSQFAKAPKDNDIY
jgi:hypothetical protein